MQMAEDEKHYLLFDALKVFEMHWETQGSPRRQLLKDYRLLKNYEHHTIITINIINHRDEVNHKVHARPGLQGKQRSPDAVPCVPRNRGLESNYVRRRTDFNV